MEIGILGLGQSGKSTLFQIMTGVNSRDSYGEQFVRGIAKVPDVRFDKLVEIFHPAKISPAAIPFVDVNVTGENVWNTIRQNLASVDGLLHVVNAFTDSDIGELVNRFRKLADELILSDLIVTETRLERLAKLPQKSLRAEEMCQSRILPKAKECLEAGKPLRELAIPNDELTAIKNFAFWTLKPELVVLNVSEGVSINLDEFASKSNVNAPVISICCQIEAEIATLPAVDQKEFLESAGIETPAFEKIIRTAFSLLGRICYFTVGEDEVKAWVIPAGSTAPRAASAIHKDFERGFIKAEVVSYDDFISCGGTLAGAKSAGKMRLEGKEYIVNDADIISFRFNV